MNPLTQSQLLSLLKKTDLSSLPTADPGSGKPWVRSDGAIGVGAYSPAGVTWNDLSGVLPLDKLPAHTHSWSDLSGVLPLDKLPAHTHSLLVPYSGATTDVDLGSYALIANRLLVGSSTGPRLDNNAGTIRARTNNGLADAPFSASKLFADGRQIGPTNSGDYYAYLGTTNSGWAIGSNIAFNTGGALGATGATIALGSNGSIGFTSTTANAQVACDAKLARAGVNTIGVYQGDGTTLGSLNLAGLFVTPSDVTSNWALSGTALVYSSYGSAQVRLDGNLSQPHLRFASNKTPFIGRGAADGASNSGFVCDSPAITMLIYGTTAGVNYASVSRPRLNIGGSTSAFSGLVGNGTTLEARLADDSAFANFSANNLTATGTASLISGSFTGTTVQQLAFGTTDNAGRGYIGFRGGSWNQIGIWGPGIAVTATPAIAVIGNSVLLGGSFAHMVNKFLFSNRTDLASTPGFEVSGGGQSMPVARFTGYSGQTANTIEAATSGGTVEFSVGPGGVTKFGTNPATIISNNCITASTGQTLYLSCNSTAPTASNSIARITDGFNGVNGLGLGSARNIGWSSDATPFGTCDASLLRPGTAQVGVRADNGLLVQNLAGSAPTPVRHGLQSSTAAPNTTSLPTGATWWQDTTANTRRFAYNDSGVIFVSPLLRSTTPATPTDLASVISVLQHWGLCA